jgi:hypothetical protein
MVRVTICFRALSGLARASVAHQNTEPDRTISFYRFFGLVQISSGGFLPLLIWIRNSTFRKVERSQAQGVKVEAPPSSYLEPENDRYNEKGSS